MSERIPQSVSKRVVFRAFLSSSGNTPATGKTIAITISKNGGAFANPAAGATNATEISNGFYYFDLGTGDTGTKGPLAWRGAEATIDDAGDVYSVVNATNADFTALPNAAADAAGGVPISDAGGLDLDARLDAAVSSRAPASTALSTAQWSNTRAGYLDVLQFLPSVTAGAAGGLLIAGSNAGTTTFNALTVTNALTVGSITNNGTLTQTGVVNINGLVSMLDGLYITTSNTSRVGALIIQNEAASGSGSAVSIGNLNGASGAALYIYHNTHVGLRIGSGVGVDSVDVDNGFKVNGALQVDSMTVVNNLVAGGIVANITGNLSGTTGNTANINAIKTSTDNLPSAVKKNTAYNNFKFPMYDTAGVLATGKTVTAQRIIDSGSIAACTNSVVEVSDGAYRINLSAADLNGDCILFLFTATGCRPTVLTIMTKP